MINDRFKITIMGTEYNVIIKDDLDNFAEPNLLDGCTDLVEKIIYIKTLNGYLIDEVDENIERSEKRQIVTLYHELLHAILYECGLAFSSNSTSAWAMNEEMVDWFALKYRTISFIFTEAENKLSQCNCEFLKNDLTK